MLQGLKHPARLLGRYAAFSKSAARPITVRHQAGIGFLSYIPGGGLVPDSRSINRACDDMLRSVDRATRELKDIYNTHERLGQDFRNDRRFTSLAGKIRDSIRENERAISKLKSHVEDVRRANR